MELSNWKDFLSERSREVLTQAIEESRRRNHYYLGTEHIFIALVRLEETFFKEIMADLNVDPQHIIQFFDEHLPPPKEYLGTGLKIPPSTKNVLKLALQESQKQKRKVIEPTDLFAAIFQESEGIAVKIFKDLGIEPDVVHQMIVFKARLQEQRTEEFKRKFELPPYLKYLGVNLNKLARLGKLPLIFGREK